jgi:hypothetical protein
MKTKILIPITILAIVSMACSVSFNLPRAPKGETVTFPVKETLPTDRQNLSVELQVGAAELQVSSGSTNLVEGEIRYNNPDWKPAIERTDGKVVVSQPKMNDMNYIPRSDSLNQWDLKIGSAPMDLEVKAGAYKGVIKLTDYALKNFTVNDGASESKVTFDNPNKSEMQKLVYKTGASKVDLIGLSNANFKEMSFDSGAGSYKLDFSGKLTRDAEVTIKSGVSNVEIVIPEGTNSQINLHGGLNNVELEGTWTSSGSEYSTSGSGPKITIDIDMGVGNIHLTSK